MDYAQHIRPMVSYFFDRLKAHDTTTQEGMVSAVIAEGKNVKAIAAACEATDGYEENLPEVEVAFANLEATTPEGDLLFTTFNWMLNRYRLATNVEEEMSLVVLMPRVAHYLQKSTQS